MRPEATWQDLDRAALSRAYDNSGAVAESAAYLAAWRTRGAVLRAGPGHSLDIPYGPLPRNRIDLFACGRRCAPLLAFIHGGYWQRNAKEGFACMAEGPLARGLDVALIGYTLAPDASLSRIVEEIRAALRTLRARDAALGLDPGPGRRRLVVSGWSAGGHLAALALDWPEVDAGLAISGVFDLAPVARTSLNDALDLTPEEVETLSPIRRMTPRAAPLVIAYGAEELPELQRQSRDYAAARTAPDRPTRIRALDGRNHFSILEDLIAPEGVLAGLAADLARAET